MSRRARLRLAALTCLGLALAATVAEPATRYDPRLRFRTISTPRFDIHYHQREEALALRLARIVEESAAEVDAAVGPADGRVQVILVDQHDLSNGWATPLPYNTIEISAAAPRADSTIGNTDDWLRLVFVHEYTHIAHLSRAGGWIGGLRRGLGRFPLLFPNLYQPTWGIEGIATWQESAVTGAGRVPAGDFRQLIRRAAAGGRFEPLDRANGGTLDWPSGAIPYLYGAYFHQYLADHYGAASLRRLADETARRLPYLGFRAYRKVYGRSLGQLWRDFEASTARPGPDAAITSETSQPRRLTSHGFRVSSPRYAPDGRLFYAAASPHHFPALRAIDSPGAAPRQVAPRYLGHSIGIAGTELVVDDLDLVRSVGLQSDLYLVDPEGGGRRRLTREARAADPDVSSAGVVVCTVQMSDRRALATLALDPGAGVQAPVALVSEAGTDFSAPRWSPDGRWIAAARRRLHGPSEIVLVDPQDGQVRPLASLPGGRSTSPAWMPDGRRVLFSSAVDGHPFRVYTVDVATGALARLEGAGASAEAPDVSPDGRTLVFVGYTPAGYDLFSLPLDDARWAPAGAPAAPAAAAGVAAPDPPALNSRPYSPWPTILPRFWTPTLESDAGETVVGAATGSLDALGRHAYGIEAGWSSRARPDWHLAYAYDRWRPTFFAAWSDDTDPWRGGERRTTEADAGLLWRVSRIRFSHATFAAVHAEVERLACDSCPRPVDVRRRTNALRLGWEFSNARDFGFSISDEEGGRLAVTTELPSTALGSDGSGAAVTVDGRRYWRLGPRHAVVAVRAGAAGSWGDDAAVRQFSASGHGPQPGGFGFGQGAIGLLRGFAEDDVLGTRAAVLNVDYRMPLVRVDRGVGTVPVFFRSLHGAVFADAGHAWTGRARWPEARYALGAEVSADTVVGYVLPVTVTAGAAWRRDGATGGNGVVAFGRIGRAF